MRTSAFVVAVACGLMTTARLGGDAAPARLQVAFIAREPRLAAPSSVTAPKQEGWPAAGSTVHWVVHVLNRGSATVSRVSYTWRDDGATAGGGLIDLPPGETTLSLPWRWTFARHQIAFEIVPPADSGDAPDDNQLTVASDALSLDLFIQQATYDWMLQEGRPGFERWAQGQIEGWHGILARGVFPSTPDAVLDRIRLENVTVFPDDQRPSNADVIHADLHWVFPNVALDSRFLHLRAPSNVVADQTIVLHELLHERGLIDLYAYHVYHTFGGDADGRINVVENGKPVVGTFLMPALSESSSAIPVYFFPIGGLMSADYRAATAALTEQCVNGLNLWAGRRTPWWLDTFGNAINGWTNATGAQRVSYVALLPQRTDVSVVDSDGAPVSGASIDLYLDHNPAPYHKTYPAQPDLSLTMSGTAIPLPVGPIVALPAPPPAPGLPPSHGLSPARSMSADSRGVFALPGRLFDGLPETSSLPKSHVIIVAVKTSRGRGYGFLPVYFLNLEYFRGNRELATIQLKVKMHPW